MFRDRCGEFWQDERGQDMVEYALLVAVIALTGGLAIVPVAPSLQVLYSKVVSILRRY